MRNLLDRSSQRIINILDILVTNEDWITFSELSKEVDASVRTISEDIGIIRKRWGADLNIEVSTKWGIKLHNQSVATIGCVFIQLFNESTALKWLREIFFYPGNLIDFYEERLYVSRSTLIRVLPNINKYLKTIGIEIKRNNSQYRVVGNNETYIRQLFAGFLLELQGLELKKWDIDINLSLIAEIIQRILMENLESEEISLVFRDDLALLYYITYYLVSLIREKQGFHDANYGKNISYAGTLIDDEELRYLRLFFPDITPDAIRPIHGFILSQYKGWDNLEEKLLVKREASLFYQRLFNSIPLSPEEEKRKELTFTLQSLYLLQKIRPFFNSTLFDRIHYFSMTLKKNNQSLFQWTERSLSIFSEKTGLNMSTRIDDLLYWNSLILPEINLNRKTMRLLIISDFGIKHAHFIKGYLKQYFENDVSDLTIDVGAFPEVLSKGNFDKYHIVITTIPHLSINHDNVVLINDYPTEANMFELYRASRLVLSAENC